MTNCLNIMTAHNKKCKNAKMQKDNYFILFSVLNL